MKKVVYWPVYSLVWGGDWRAVKVEIPLQRKGIFARIKVNKNVDKRGSISYKIHK